MASLTRFCSISMEMPRVAMKSATAPLMLAALLLFMTSLFANRFGQGFLIDQTRIPSDPAEIADRSFHGRLKNPVIARMHIGSDRNVAIRVGEFDRSPGRVETTGRARGHARQCRRDLRDHSRLGQPVFEAHICDFTGTQEANEAGSHVARHGASMRVYVDATCGPYQYALVGQALHHQLEIVRVRFAKQG